MKDSPRSSVHRIGMRLFAAHLAALVVAVGSVTSASLADTLYVDASAPAGGDGASWNSAHRFLQNALFAAGPGSGVSEIRIAQGVYKPDRTEANPQGTGNREASFNLIGGVTLRGGYAGLAGTDPDERDIAAFETILSGDLLGNDGPDFTGMGDNSYRVVHALNLSVPATLDGLTIASGNGSTTSGGGLRSTESQLIIRDCTFRSNRASGAGGGGAVFRSNSTAEIYRCTFDTNRAFEGPGGGVFTTSNSCVTLADSIFTNNESLFGGGAVLTPCSAVISGVQFHGNKASSVGGALVLVKASSPLEVRDCSFTSNFSGSFGGTVVEEIGATYINCLFAHNSSSAGGVFLYKNIFPPTIINCTVAHNTGYAFTIDISSLASGSPQLRVVNSILWNNSQGHFDSYSVSVAYVDYSNIEGGWTGPGSNNISTDPMFVQPFNHDFRLSFGSPCVDAGDNSAVPPHVTTDLAGNPRIQNGVVDMGAYEGEFEPEPPTAFATGINIGELRVLVPLGLPHQPIFKPAAVIWNIGGPDGAWAQATQYATDQHPGAGGYKTVGPTLEFETSLENGNLYARLFISMDESELGDINPVDLDLAYYDPATNNWQLAVSNNTENSPGHKSPVGERHVQIGGSFVVSPNLGDYGIYWNQDLQRVLVWAVVDHANANFQPGHVGCLGDLDDPKNHVGTSDLLALLGAWGQLGGPADLNWDGVVDVSDLLILLGNWGDCR